MTSIWNPKHGPLFIDTSALIALLNPRDQYHPRALQFLQETGNALRGVTSNLILGELLTFFSRYGDLKPVLDLQSQMLSDPRFEIVWLNTELHLAASKILKKFQDQSLSFADASSFAIMQQQRLKYAFSFDEDFTRASFICVPG